MDQVDETVASAAGEPDLEREIHYALGAEALQWHTREAKAERVCWPMFGYVKMVALPAVALLLFVVAMLIPGPMGVRVAVYVLVIAAVFVPLTLRWRREKREHERLKDRYAGMSDRRYRLRVAGMPGQLERLRGLVEKETEEFEPRIVRVGRGKRAGWRDGGVLAMLFLTAWVALSFVKRMGRFDFGMEGMIIAFGSLLLTFTTWSFLWPTYLRFVPGRMDILTYGVLGRGRPRVRSIDLRAARVLVMVPGSAVVFVPDQAAPVELDVGWLPGSEEFVFERAILAAAKSEAEAPGLPEGELVG